MKVRLLVVPFLLILLGACSTITETSSYDYTNHSITIGADSIVDEKFNSILAPYKLEVESKMSEVIAHSDSALTSFRPESPLSNFLSDLILGFGSDYALENDLTVLPQFSLFNHGGIRSSFPEGDITIRNAFELMPFENEMVLLLLKGQQVIDLADYIASRNGEGVSGIVFGMYDNKAVDIKVQGLKVDKNKRYWLVTSDYMANGGDGMKVLTWAEDRINTEMKMRDVIIDYLKAMNARGEKVKAKIDGRIYHVE
jgi:2',3'-cyclic-nucleotide 2'-phosphodiesterase (5'-nucleotidase family)